MMKSFFWFILLAVVACNGTSSDTASNVSAVSQIPESAVVQDYTAVPGLQRATIKQGDKTLSEGDFLDGQHHGSWTVYDASGKVSSITTYLNGQKQGVELRFDNLGYVTEKAYYHQDKLDGEYLVFKRRSIVERRNYAGGLLHGKLEKFYTDGTTMEESSYVDGKIDGLARWYDADGNLKIEYTYQMGELVDN